MSPVPMQMWAGRAQSRCRCGRDEPSPRADVCGASPVPAQMWAESAQPVPAQVAAGLPRRLRWARSARRCTRTTAADRHRAHTRRSALHADGNDHGDQDACARARVKERMCVRVWVCVCMCEFVSVSVCVSGRLVQRWERRGECAYCRAATSPTVRPYVSTRLERPTLREYSPCATDPT